MIALVLSLSFVMVWPIRAVGQIRNADPRRRRLVILQGAAIVGSFFLLESTPRLIIGTPFEAPVFYQSLVFLVFPITMLISGVGLGFSKPLLWRWVRGAGLIAGACASFLVLSDVVRLRSENPKVWVEAVMHLGAFSGRWDRASFESILRIDLPPEQLGEVLWDYRRRFYDEKLLEPDDAAVPAFVELVRGRSKGESLLVLASHYRMSGLSPEQVSAYAAEVSSKRGDSGVAAPIWRSVVQPWADDQRLGQFLSSSDPLLQEFALRRIALDRGAVWLPRLQERILSLSERNRRHALLVISLLSGRRFSVDQWEEASRAKDLTYLHVDCSRFGALELSALRLEDEAALNVCYREKVRRGEIALDWIDLPLDAEYLRRLRRVFQQR